jgi:hypothetical protein
MKLSHAIKLLKSVENSHGDVDLAVLCNIDGDCPEFTSEFTMELMVVDGYSAVVMSPIGSLIHHVQAVAVPRLHLVKENC